MAGRILTALEPMDSDVDLADPAQRRELRRRHGRILIVIAAGGVLGALLRYQLGRWWSTPVPQFPWTTLLINTSGCLVIGTFMVLITERWSHTPWSGRSSAPGYSAATPRSPPTPSTSCYLSAPVNPSPPGCTWSAP